MGFQKFTRPILAPRVHVDTVNLRPDYEDGVKEARLQWTDEDGTLEYGLPGGTVVLQVGQEQVVKAVNKTGITIPNGTPIYEWSERLALAGPVYATRLWSPASWTSTSNTRARRCLTCSKPIR